MKSGHIGVCDQMKAPKVYYREFQKDDDQLKNTYVYLKKKPKSESRSSEN